MKKLFLILPLFIATFAVSKADVQTPVKELSIPTLEVNLGAVPTINLKIDSISNVLSHAFTHENFQKMHSVYDLQKDIVSTAKQYMGIRYRRGRMNPKIGFDCSGFTKYIFNKFDIELERVSGSQFNKETEITDRHDLQVGDLVFFSGRKISKRIGHVGIVTHIDPETGHFSFIHASCSSGITETKSTSTYYANRFLKACRVIGNQITQD